MIVPPPPIDRRLVDTVDVDTTPSGDGVATGSVNVNAVNREWGEL